MGGLTTFFFATLILVFARGGGYITKALSHPFPVALGGLAYALYLVHPPVLVFYKFRQLAFPPLPTWVMAILLAALLLTMAQALHVLVEIPCWRGITGLAGKARSILRAHRPAPATANSLHHARDATTAAAVDLASMAVARWLGSVMRRHDRALDLDGHVPLERAGFKRL